MSAYVVDPITINRVVNALEFAKNDRMNYPNKFPYPYEY